MEAYLESMHDDFDECAKYQSELRSTSAAQAKRIADLELSAKRYEIVRKLNARQFTEMYKRNIESGIPFDTLVDSMAASKNGE